MKKKEFIYYTINTYADDGTNVFYGKPQGIGDYDVFASDQAACDWAQENDCMDYCIKEESDDITNIQNYHFVDVDDDEFKQILFKLEVAGKILDGKDYIYNGFKVKLFHDGIQIDSSFHCWRDVYSEFHKEGFLGNLLERVCQYERVIYLLNDKQAKIAESLKELLQKAEEENMGLLIDQGKNQIIPFNAEHIDYVSVSESYANEDLVIDTTRLKKLGVPIYATFTEGEEVVIGQIV